MDALMACLIFFVCCRRFFSCGKRARENKYLVRYGACRSCVFGTIRCMSIMCVWYDTVHINHACLVVIGVLLLLHTKVAAPFACAVACGGLLIARSLGMRDLWPPSSIAPSAARPIIFRRPSAAFFGRAVARSIAPSIGRSTSSLVSLLFSDFVAAI